MTNFIEKPTFGHYFDNSSFSLKNKYLIQLLAIVYFNTYIGVIRGAEHEKNGFSVQ